MSKALLKLIKDLLNLKLEQSHRYLTTSNKAFLKNERLTERCSIFNQICHIDIIFLLEPRIDGEHQDGRYEEKCVQTDTKSISDRHIVTLYKHFLSIL